VALLPLAFAWVGCLYLPVMQTFPFAVRGNTAELRRSDYRLLTSALYSEEDYRNSKKDFWPAFTPIFQATGALNCVVHPADSPGSMGCRTARGKLRQVQKLSAV